MRRLMQFIALTTMCAFLVAPVLHDVLPHGHGGHSHDDAKVTVIWSSLHTVLHAEKAAFLSQIFSLTVLAFLVLPVVCVRGCNLRAFAGDAMRGDLLHKGILPFRSFS